MPALGEMKMTHDKHGYPLNGFFVAHRRFIGHPAPKQSTWADILDGPQVDDEAVIECILEAWKHDQFAPDRDDLRVWHIVPGKPAEDCTDWAIKTVHEAVQLKAEGF
jgi:hypothetical protein